MKTNRRNFLRQTLFAGGLVASTTPLELIAADGDTVSEDEQPAKSMGYRHDAVQVDLAAFPKRSGDAGQKQFCDNCSLLVQLAMNLS